MRSQRATARLVLIALPHLRAPGLPAPPLPRAGPSGPDVSVARRPGATNRMSTPAPPLEYPWPVRIHGRDARAGGGMEYSSFPVLVVDDDLKDDTAAGRAARAMIAELNDARPQRHRGRHLRRRRDGPELQPGHRLPDAGVGLRRRRGRRRAPGARHHRPRPLARPLAADLRRHRPGAARASCPTTPCAG